MAENNGNNGSVDLLFDEGMCEQYLFGELSGDDQERFETAYFTDDVFFDRFMTVKTEMLDLYVRGELEPEKQERMRIHFSQTEPRRQQIEESTQFIDTVTGLSAEGKVFPSIIPESRSFSWFPRALSLGWAAAAILLLAGMGFWWMWTQQPTDNNADVAAVQTAPEPQHSGEIPVAEVGASPSIEEKGEEVSTEKPSNEKTTDVSKRIERPTRHAQAVHKARDPLKAMLVLAAVSTRDISDANKLKIYADTTNVSIVVPVRSSHGRYTAIISTVGGDVRWQKKKVKKNASGRPTIDLAPGTLNGTDYILTLSRVSPGSRSSETVGDYYFHVVRSEQKTPVTLSPK